VPPDTAFVAYFGHIIGYGAGYYGYAWADAIAADMATVFEQSPDGFFDQTTGLRMRNEIYAVGDSRDITSHREIPGPPAFARPVPQAHRCEMTARPSALRIDHATRSEQPGLGKPSGGGLGSLN